VKILGLFCLLLILPLQVLAQRELTSYVDPFIGTGGHGHTYPGATMPFGMVQLSPDTRLTGWDGVSGYHYSDKLIYGFSHTHLSGTGIADYCDILLMPTLAEAFQNGAVGSQTGPSYVAGFSHQNETARPGYYSVKLDNQIRVELTATERVGLHRYTYPQDAESGYVTLDLAHRDRVLESYLRVVDSTHIEGYRRSSSWAKDQLVFFIAEFSEPFRSVRIAKDGRVSDTTTVRGTNLKASFSFLTRDRHTVLVKLAISAVSLDGARKNLKAEVDQWDFDKVRADANRAWNAELHKIQVSGGPESQLKTFYTALYHAMLAPNLFMDVDGQYRGRDFQNHTAKGFRNYTVFSIWDTFRAAHPLYTIIDQKRTADFINTFLAQYKEGGRLPVWELAANETDTMIGYHAVSVIADATAKGIDGFDRQLAFAAMKHSAELKHFGQGSYIEHGYVDMEDEKESVSRTLEYAYDDWCIAQMARMLGRPDDYQRYLRRAQSYQNLFDPESGFMRPRSNAAWLAPFDPREVSFSFTEANSWQYTFFAPQDISGLIELMGGKTRFASKLDGLFSAESKTTGREQADITGLMGQYAHGNEPSHHVAYLYDYVNQPWKTQHRARQIMDQFYQPEPDGLVGNEDCGQMSAWYVLSAAGFYPVTPGAPIYAIGSPLFPEARFNLENGKSFTIKAHGVSTRNFYIQSAKLNGRPYSKSFITHSALMAGGEMVFEMGPRPNPKWGSGPNDAPVSQITDSRILPTPVIKTAGKTFKERQEISFETLAGNLKVYYTIDGGEPDRVGQEFTKPFFIDGSLTVKARSFDGQGKSSLVATAAFHKIPHNWRLQLNATYSPQYPGGGDLALIDGIRGTTNFSGGAWQGYDGKDFEAIVDLGEMRDVSKLGAGFLQETRSWIVMPRRIEFELSDDGRSFVKALSISNDVPVDASETVIKDFVGTIAPRKCRYLKVKAYNYGKLPDWHPGRGGDAWIFIDEIIIE
jgi:predicted alpha-1,2-mannosidase